MNTNERMRELLGAAADIAPISISPEFYMLVAGGFKEVEGCVFFREFFHHDAATAWMYHDRTGYECAVNKIHIEDYLERDAAREPVALAATAIAFARFLATYLERFSTERFRIIASVDGRTSTLRFHKLREGESWLADDLDGYQDEAVAVLDTHDTGRNDAASRDQATEGDPPT